MISFIKNYWALILGLGMLIVSLLGFVWVVVITHSGGTPTNFTIALAIAVTFMITGITAIDMHIKHNK